MNDELGHTDNTHDDFFKKVEIPFEKDKDAMWTMLDDKIQEQSSGSNHGKIIILQWSKYAAAAVLALLLTSTFYLRVYTEKIECPKGQQMAHTLPDGSKVTMNAESAISYQPYWWRFKREVDFSGEAFFNIEKGQKFAINSAQGTTEILGTSFNVFARELEYKVFCKTGRVRVINAKNDVEFIIMPGEMAVFDSKLQKSEVRKPSLTHVLAWQNDSFNFNSQPLQKVVKELERQYDVKITLQIKNLDQLIYTGHFKKSKNVETPLKYICKSFNLKFKKVSKGHYKVSSQKK